MEAWALDWLNLLVRLLHFVAGIAWIGSSFYFIWLDNHLEPKEGDEDIAGEVWSVHGGGFYRAEKFRVAPRKLPATLHWFKWEAYTTWLSGMFLLALVYWYGAEIYLVNPAVLELSRPLAIALSVAFIAGGWHIYDGLCRSPLAKSDRALSVVVLVLCVLLAWGLCKVYGGRGAYIHFGVVLGTIMVANVLFVIIPGQKKMVDAAARGEVPDPGPGIRGKQRSVHNTYFTLPVLFTMTSNHFAMTYSHEYNWIILALIAVAGALLRAWFVARHKGRAPLLPIVVATLLLVIAALLVLPRGGAPVPAGDAGFNAVREIVHERCTSCHSSNPTYPAFPSAPMGVVLDSDDEIRAAMQRIHESTVVTKTMPIGNLTSMSEEERAVIDTWFRSGQAGQDDD